MIKRVKIKNFKCYGDPGADFSLKRINFIFGDNSTGKSSFLQLIRMAFNGESKKIDENFNKYVFKQENDRKIELHVTATREGEDKSPIYSCFKEKDKPFDGPRCVGWMDKEGISHPLSSDVESAYEKDKRLWLPIDAVLHFEAARPSRLGKEEKETSLNFDTFLRVEEVDYVNRFFDALQLPYKAENKKELKDTDFGITLLRKNVGAGIDVLYELALKLYDWRAKVKNSSDCVLLELEEPESHLNERQISTLMNFIFQEAQELPNGQLIVECHSELIALKAMNVLSKKNFNITLKDIQVLYVEKGNEGTEVLECHLGENGSIYDWPDNDGFFSARDKIIFGE